MNYTIKHITAEKELDETLAFARRIFVDIQTEVNPENERKNWLERMELNNELLLYVESDSEILGTVFGFIDDNNNMNVGIVAVDNRLRKKGVAREMMLLLEERAKKYDIHLIVLGAVQTAEGFYSKLGYTGTLLIQSEKYSIDELLSLNTKYKVNYAKIYDGTINQINLALPKADRELQRRYETELPGCNTQMMFWKNI